MNSEYLKGPDKWPLKKIINVGFISSLENSHQNKLIKQHMVTITGGSGGPLWPVGLQSLASLGPWSRAAWCWGPTRRLPHTGEQPSMSAAGPACS